MNRAKILDLHRRAAVVLGYVNPGFTYHRGGFVSARPYFTQAPSAQGSIPRLRKGGTDIIVCSHGINDKTRFLGDEGVDYMLRCLDALTTEIERRAETVLIQTRRDMDRAVRETKFGIILHLTGAPINGSLAVLRAYGRLGIRGIHPFCDDPAIGGFAYGSARTGLKPWGREIIREMERLSMVVDLAHTNDRTFWQVLRVVTKPVIDSHTACRKFVNVDRNCTDDQLRAIAETGGVSGVHFSSQFLEPLDNRSRKTNEKALRAFHKKLATMEQRYKDPYEFLSHRWDPMEWPKSLGGAIEDGTEIRRATIRKLLEHLDHMVEVAGINHVGIGADYDLGDTCGGLETADKLPNLTLELARRGYRAEDIRKILGGNFLRVYRQALPA